MRSAPLVIHSARLRLFVLWTSAVVMITCFVQLVLPLLAMLQLESEREILVDRLAASDILLPLYNEMQASGYAAQLEALTPGVGPEHLKQKDVEQVSTLFSKLAEDHSMVAGRIKVRVISGKDNRKLHVSLPLIGAYANLGGLMDQLLRIAAVDVVDRVSFKRGDKNDQMEIEFQMLLE